MNAFARLDDCIALTHGLLLNLQPSEVEVVIAHELGHLAKRHPVQMGLSAVLQPFGPMAKYLQLRARQRMVRMVIKVDLLLSNKSSYNLVWESPSH